MEIVQLIKNKCINKISANIEVEYFLHKFARFLSYHE